VFPLLTISQKRRFHHRQQLQRSISYKHDPSQFGKKFFFLRLVFLACGKVSHRQKKKRRLKINKTASCLLPPSSFSICDCVSGATERWKKGELL
jgi:hypothetical protein